MTIELTTWKLDDKYIHEVVVIEDKGSRASRSVLNTEEEITPATIQKFTNTLKSTTSITQDVLNKEITEAVAKFNKERVVIELHYRNGVELSRLKNDVEALVRSSMSHEVINWTILNLQAEGVVQCTDEERKAATSKAFRLNIDQMIDKSEAISKAAVRGNESVDMVALSLAVIREIAIEALNA